MASHFKLSSSLCPSSVEEKNYMSRVPYSNTIGCLMYAMLCTRSDISHAVGVVSKYMANPKTLECSEMSASILKRHK